MVDGGVSRLDCGIGGREADVRRKAEINHHRSSPSIVNGAEVTKYDGFIRYIS